MNLIIYNDQHTNDQQMKEILTSYLQTISFVQFYFITFRNQANEIEIEDHIMYIKGEETMRPGILDKTIRAIQYCTDHFQFDYILRSNVSTVIDFSLLKQDHSVHYSGCNIHTLSWLDPGSGIHDTSLFGTSWAQGIYIMLDNKASAYLLKHKDELRMDIIDDVAIGLLLSTSYSPVMIGNMSMNSEQTALCYRNKSTNREDDIVRMKRIVASLLSEKHELL